MPPTSKTSETSFSLGTRREWSLHKKYFFTNEQTEFAQVDSTFGTSLEQFIKKGAVGSYDVSCHTC